MKRVTIWIIILLLILVSIGNDKSIEVSDRTLVHAVGIDEDESGCTITLQIFKSDGAGSDTQIDPSKPNTRVISNTAKTFDEAMSLCENQLGNYLFIGHNQVIVIGSGTDLSDPEELLSYFIRNKDNFLGVDIVLAENTAKEILEIQIPTGTITMENFKEIIKMYRDKGEAVPSSMVDFINQCKKADKTATLPVVSKKQEDSSQSQQGEQSSQSQGQENGSQQSQQQGQSDSSQSENSQQQNESQQGGQQQSGGEEQSQQSQGGGGEESQSTQESIAIEKNAVISKGKVVGEISPEETQWVNLMNNRTDYAMITIDYKNTKITVDLKKRSSKPKVRVKDNKLIYDVDISLIATTENSTYTEKDKEKIAEIIKEEVTRKCEETFNKVFVEYDADIFDLCRLIRHYCPKVHLQYKDNFDVLKDNTVLNISVDCIAK